MSSDIKDLINLQIIKKGKKAFVSLIAERTGKTESTILRWIESGIPDGHSAYLVATACGASDDHALQIAKGFSLRNMKARRAG